MEVSIHAVSLNFKDVLNFLLPAKDAYVGHDAPPLPGVDFSGVMMAIPIDANPDEACAFSVGEKVYGLSFDMLRSKARASTDSIAKMPYKISYNGACSLPMVLFTVIYSLKE